MLQFQLYRNVLKKHPEKYRIVEVVVCYLSCGHKACLYMKLYNNNNNNDNDNNNNNNNNNNNDEHLISNYIYNQGIQDLISNKNFVQESDSHAEVSVLVRI